MSIIVEYVGYDGSFKEWAARYALFWLELLDAILNILTLGIVVFGLSFWWVITYPECINERKRKKDTDDA